MSIRRLYLPGYVVLPWFKYGVTPTSAAANGSFNLLRYQLVVMSYKISHMTYLVSIVPTITQRLKAAYSTWSLYFGFRSCLSQADEACQ